jgi:hypothetical protein
VAALDEVDEVAEPPIGATMPVGWLTTEDERTGVEDGRTEPEVAPRVAVTTTTTVSMAVAVCTRVTMARSSNHGIAAALAARAEAKKMELRIVVAMRELRLGGGSC